MFDEKKVTVLFIPQKKKCGKKKQIKIRLYSGRFYRSSGNWFFSFCLLGSIFYALNYSRYLLGFTNIFNERMENELQAEGFLFYFLFCFKCKETKKKKNLIRTVPSSKRLIFSNCKAKFWNKYLLNVPLVVLQLIKLGIRWR